MEHNYIFNYVYYLGHFLALANLYLVKIVYSINGCILIEITYFRCLYISCWSRMMSIDENFLTTICMQINFIIAMLQFLINFQCEEHLVNYSYQASRNLFGLTGPLGDIYPTFRFW